MPLRWPQERFHGRLFYPHSLRFPSPLLSRQLLTHLPQLNTSTLGHDLIPTTTTSSGSTPTATSIGSFVSGLVHNVTGEIEGDFNDIVGDVADKLAKKLGIHQWYSLHLMDLCYGEYKPNATEKGANKNVTKCSNATVMCKFSRSILPSNEWNAGLTWSLNRPLRHLQAIERRIGTRSPPSQPLRYKMARPNPRWPEWTQYRHGRKFRPLRHWHRRCRPRNPHRTRCILLARLAADFTRKLGSREHRFLRSAHCIGYRDGCAEQGDWYHKQAWKSHWGVCL